MSAIKRPSDALVPVVEPKKTRTDLMQYTAKDKQLLETAVSNNTFQIIPGFQSINSILGRSKNFNPMCPDYALGRSWWRDI